MVETWFTSELFVQTILPFLLVFTIVFAILQKTKILGDDKRQIDAIVGLVIGLIFVAFGNATDVVVRMIPILGIALVVILVFMLLLGSLYGPGDFKIENWLKIVIGILISIVVVVTVLVLTGGLEPLVGFVVNANTGLFINLFLVLIVVGAVVAVIKGAGSSGKDS